MNSSYGECPTSYTQSNYKVLILSAVLLDYTNRRTYMWHSVAKVLININSVSHKCFLQFPESGEFAISSNRLVVKYYYLKDCQLSRKFGSIKALQLPLRTYKLRFQCSSSYNFTSPLPAHCVIFNLNKILVCLVLLLTDFSSEPNCNLCSVFLMLISKLMCSSEVQVIVNYWKLYL